MKPKLCTIEIIQEKFNYHPNPTEIFNHICKLKKETLLLESSEINNKKNLESMLIIDSALKITAFQNKVFFQSFSKNGDFILNNLDTCVPESVKNIILPKQRQFIFPKIKIKQDQDEDSKLHSISVFDALRWLLKITKKNHDFPQAMFLGGMFSYDLVNSFECIQQPKNNQKCPDFCFYLSEILITWNHQKKTCIIQGSIFNNKKTEKFRLKKRIKEIKKKLQEKTHPITTSLVPHMQIDCNKEDTEYIQIIKELQKKIKQGEIFQIVPSRKFFLPCSSPLSAYDELKKQNPSPYMFFMQDSDFTLFGASPESSLKYDPQSRKIEIHPIAGTRSRGFKKDGTIDLDLDSKIELEMRTDRKELSEHLMLVDLARNDLSRICIPGSRFVEELTKVDRYSYVMHLVSKVVGTLKEGLDILHAYRACMNMGTLTGAPKIQAMEFIAQVEGEKRGSYGGAIGYFTALEKFDMCIIIRSAYVENNIATIQAGAGIVIDSNPILEAMESRNKAKSVLNAIINSHIQNPVRTT